MLVGLPFRFLGFRLYWSPSLTPQIPPACPADRSVSRYEKRSIYARRPRITLAIEATPPRPKWRPRTISVSVAGDQMGTLLLDRLSGAISEVEVARL